LDYNNCCDFGEEITTESGYEYDPDENAQKHDEYNLDESDLGGFLGQIDESQSIDRYVEYTGMPVDNVLYPPDMKKLAEAEQSEKQAEEHPEDIISEEDVKAVRQATSEENKQAEKSRSMTIEAIEIVSEAIDDGARTMLNTGLGAKKIRSYKNKASYFKSSFAKAKTEDNPFKKLGIMAIAAAAAGIFGGVYSNSYYIEQGGKVKSMLSCAFSWIVQFDSMTVRISPFHFSPFIAGFGLWAGMLALIFLFSWLNNDMMKNSRVGHEHGNAKLMTGNSFKKYKNRFMER